MNEILDAINRIADNMNGESGSSSSNIFDVLFDISITQIIGKGDSPEPVTTVTCNRTLAEIRSAVNDGKLLNIITKYDSGTPPVMWITAQFYSSEDVPENDGEQILNNFVYMFFAGFESSANVNLSNFVVYGTIGLDGTTEELSVTDYTTFGF